MLVVPKGPCSTCSTPTGIPVQLLLYYIALCTFWVCGYVGHKMFSSAECGGERDNQDGVRVGSSGYVNQSCANMQSGNGL